jgi:hypothetical protein
MTIRLLSLLSSGRSTEEARMVARAAAVALLMVMVGGAPRIAGAQTAAGRTPATRLAGAIDVMQGRTVTRVVVEDIPALRPMVDAAMLKAGMELKLRQNGITIPDDTTERATIYPFLYLKVNVGTSGDGSLVYNVSMEYKTLLEASLRYTSDVGLVMASVWDRATLGTASRQNVGAIIRQVVDDQLTAFLDIYLDANPRK